MAWKLFLTSRSRQIWKENILSRKCKSYIQNFRFKWFHSLEKIHVVGNCCCHMILVVNEMLLLNIIIIKIIGLASLFIEKNFKFEIFQLSFIRNLSLRFLMWMFNSFVSPLSTFTSVRKLSPTLDSRPLSIRHVF